MKKRPKTISLIGYACGAGGKVGGAKEGPRIYRKLRLLERLEALGLNVNDRGNATHQETETQTTSSDNLDKKLIHEREKNIRRLAPVYTACKSLYEHTFQALQAEEFPLILGGDHSLSIGSIAAVADFYRLKKKKIGLLWIDTHPDINVPETSPSKAPFGMSVAVLLGHLPGALASLQKYSPAIETQNLVYVGLRDIDPGEQEVLRSKNITAFTIREIDELGMAEVMKRAIRIATRKTEGFAVSFDLDVCDPALVPGTGTPYRGGLTFRETHLALELLAESQKMLSFEIVELNPSLDLGFQTAELALSCIETTFGKTIL